MLLPIVNWVAAGFFAVYFYRRKTGSLLNVGSGVRMGWITGILTFGLSAVVFMAQQLPAALSGRLGAVLQEQMKNLPAGNPMVQQLIQFVQSGQGIFAVLFFALIALFLFCDLPQHGRRRAGRKVGRPQLSGNGGAVSQPQ